VSQNICILRGVSQLGIEKLSDIKSLFPENADIAKLESISPACLSSVKSKLVSDDKFFTSLKYKIADIIAVKDIASLDIASLKALPYSSSNFSGFDLTSYLSETDFTCNQKDITNLNSIATTLASSFLKPEVLKNLKSPLLGGSSKVLKEGQIQVKIRQILSNGTSCKQFKHVLSIFNKLAEILGPNVCSSSIEFKSIDPPSKCPLDSTFSQGIWAFSNASALMENYNIIMKNYEGFEKLQEKLRSIHK
jgi:hypothetical protein